MSKPEEEWVITNPTRTDEFGRDAWGRWGWGTGIVKTRWASGSPVEHFWRCRGNGEAFFGYIQMAGKRVPKSVETRINKICKRWVADQAEKKQNALFGAKRRRRRTR